MFIGFNVMKLKVQTHIYNKIIYSYNFYLKNKIIEVKVRKKSLIKKLFTAVIYESFNFKMYCLLYWSSFIKKPFDFLTYTFLCYT